MNYNHERLKQLGVEIVMVDADHTGNGKTRPADVFMGLQIRLYLAVGAKVLMTSNVCQAVGLTNGATGVVMDIIYDENSESTSDSQMPKYVWVDFGETYTGPTFFPGNEARRGWFPVQPMTATEVQYGRGGQRQEATRTMLPLRLAWAWTVWKAQGQTIRGKMVIDLTEKEKECGLTYVAFSRATLLKNIGIKGGMTFERFTKKIRNHKKTGPRNAELEELRQRVNATIARLSEQQEQLASDSDADSMDVEEEGFSTN